MSKKSRQHATRAAREALQARRQRTPQEALQALYGGIPDVGCKGLCHGSCGPIAMSRLEAERIEAALGGPLPMFTATESLDCPLLTEEGRCSVYADRPALCRIWGAAVDLECPHGCRPKRRLTWEQVAALFGAIEALPGQGGGRVWLMPADWLTALGRANGLTGRDVEVYATLMRKQGRDKAAGGLTEEETALHARLMRRTALPSHEQIEAEYAWLLVERSTDAEALSGSESDPMPPHPAEMGETADGL